MYNKFPVFSPAVRGILRQYLCSTTATIAVIMTGNAMGWPSPTHPLLLSPESPVPGMTTDDTSWMISLMYFGNLFSPIPCGYIMEAIGRKNTLLFLNVIPLASWLLIIFTKTVLWLYIARFMAGLWLGIVYTVVPIYLGEIAEPRVRGSLSTFFAIMTYVGVLFEYVVGPFVSYDNLAITSGMFCIIFFVTFTFMPETPYYLVKMNKSEEAREALFWLRGDTPDVDVELKKIENAVSQQMANKGTIKDLFATRANKKAVITVGVLSILQRLSGIGAMIAYTSVTLPKGAIHHVTTHQCVIVLGSVWVFSTLISSFLVDRLGRKILLIVSALGCGVATFLAGTWFLLDAKTDIDVTSLNWAPFACFLLHGFFYSIGLNPIVTTIKGEVFAASIKGVASAVTSLMLAVASFFLNKSYQIFADEIGMFANYWMYATGCFIAVIFTVTYVIETKGKTLQEIQDQLNGVTPPIDNKENIVSKL
uniref:Major facilitator superfamily (MFS) profile domain-containing protein n=2 Tax=Lygus hesperus TaxID=30085 RepID=A0A0K8SIS7_LYGHE